MTIFDLVDDFYTQDEEWNTVLEQNYAEEFLRRKMWQGATDDELVKIWDYITILCIYVGNSDSYLGDMTREDFIDCVGWCCRNVSGFTATAENVASFLATVIDLFAYLCKKHIITSDKAPVEAREKLLTDNGLQVIAQDGSFLPKFERYNLYATPDLPTKIFLNINERMHALLESIRKFYQRKEYARDMSYATYLYHGIMTGNAPGGEIDAEEVAQTFWDYFLFDYRLLNNDKTPMEQYRDKAKDRRYKTLVADFDLLDELIQARLVLFEVTEKTEDGFYVCYDILNNETYRLMLPIEDDMDTSDYVFMGHIFYDNSMVMNFVRGMFMSNTARKSFIEIMLKAKNWFAVRKGGDVSWDDFIKRNPILIRNVSFVYSALPFLGSFNYETKIHDYQPAEYYPREADELFKLLPEIMYVSGFACYDINLTLTMLCDYFRHKLHFEMQDYRLEEWAAGVICCYIKLNMVYKDCLERATEICHCKRKQAVAKVTEKIETDLALEPFDPRYVNEEGIMMMLMN